MKSGAMVVSNGQVHISGVMFGVVTELQNISFLSFVLYIMEPTLWHIWLKGGGN